MPSTDRNCGGCRYWSQMIAQVSPRSASAAVEAMCLAPEGGVAKGTYTRRSDTCGVFAYDTAGKVDDPPNYGEEVLPIYAAQAAAKHPNGAPKYAPDGTMLDDKGNRSIFDDIAD